ncbi:MAG TPA: sialidase, partial [Bryobacteraceae bacterium]|nr:sialidase [Bryobacteraceae bacterium]
MNSIKSMLSGILLLCFLAASAAAQSTHEAALKSLKFREIGPAIMGGRVDDFAVVESDPRVMYVGSAAGGVFKTVNSGMNWEPIFDEQPNSSIGDIALAPSDPAVLYVGTGEPNNRQSSSWGGGVYKSLDAGKTWNFMGLKDTHHIGRIVVHPTEPNILYVAALGHLWGPNKERGVYKSTDGGATWTQSLFINEDTGVSDVAIDPQSPNTLYAAAYERRRTAFGYNG